MSRLHFVLLVLLLGAVGCSTPPGEILMLRQDAPAWPAPPQKARVAYLGQITTPADLKPGKPLWSKVTNTIFGAEPPASLVRPEGVLLDNNQRLFVVDSAGRCVHRLDLVTREYECLSLEGIVQSPLGITANTSGKLYVSDPNTGSIAVIDQQGELLSHIQAETLQRPTGLAYSKKNSLLYVADTSDHQVVVFDEQGTVRFTIGSLGTKPGQFVYPTGICINGDRLLVCDTFNFRVQVFDLTGKFLFTFGKQGNRPGQFAMPKALSCDSKGRIWVVDSRFENIQIFDRAGNLLMALGGEGPGAGQFWLPSAITIDGTDRIFVSDSYNRRVQVFQLLPEAQ